MKYLLIKADTNDADYVHSFLPITEEQIAAFTPLFEAIMNFKPYVARYKGESFGSRSVSRTCTHSHNFPTGDVLREDMGEKPPEEIYAGVVADVVFEGFTENFLPMSEHGIHTIKEIRVLDVTSEVRF